MTARSHTSLYRLYDREATLLYIGIAGNPGRRFEQHAKDKPWWSEVATMSVVHYSTREDAVAAEAAAIIDEQPRYNIVHNRGNAQRNAPRLVEPGMTGWRFSAHRSGFTRERDLYLYPELELSAYIDNWYDLDGNEQLRRYIHLVEEEDGDAYANDAIPISWFVEDNAGDICEAAPFQQLKVAWPNEPLMWESDDFLDHFTWPYNPQFGYLDWFQLPVRNERFPEFAAALGWMSSPLQPTAPLRSIWESRHTAWPMAKRDKRKERTR